MLIRPTISSPGKLPAPGVFSFHVFTRRCHGRFLPARRLNDKQREAVAAPRKATCWCWRARAETRVLVHRIASGY